MLKSLFGALVLGVSLAGIAGADDQAAARAILDEAIQAHGGEAALGKIVGMSYKITQTGIALDGGKYVISYEFFVQGCKETTRTGR